MVVDSCLNAAGDRPVALEYLERIGVDVARKVKLVVVTHWHDDHIRGISGVVLNATSARFVCSAALKSKEFFTLVVARDHLKFVEHTSGIGEFADVLDILERRGGGRYRVGPDAWATEGMLLHRGDAPWVTEVHALSPSAQTIMDSHGEIAKLLPSRGAPIERFPCIEPNELSVAILIKSCGAHMLLGGDLVRGRDHARGWRAVVASRVRPNVQSSSYKVSHHGSENADLNEIWQELLVNQPFAMLTPYARGRTPRPSESDVRRIQSKTNQLYFTAWPPTIKVPKRRGVDGMAGRLAQIVVRQERSRAKFVCVSAWLSAPLRFHASYLMGQQSGSLYAADATHSVMTHVVDRYRGDER